MPLWQADETAQLLTACAESAGGKVFIGQCRPDRSLAKRAKAPRVKTILCDLAGPFFVVQYVSVVGRFRRRRGAQTFGLMATTGQVLNLFMIFFIIGQPFNPGQSPIYEEVSAHPSRGVLRVSTDVLLPKRRIQSIQSTSIGQVRRSGFPDSSSSKDLGLPQIQGPPDSATESTWAAQSEAADAAGLLQFMLPGLGFPPLAEEVPERERERKRTCGCLVENMMRSKEAATGSDVRSPS